MPTSANYPAGSARPPRRDPAREPVTVHVPSTPDPRPGRGTAGKLGRALFFAALVVVVAEVLRMFAGTNFHVVAPGQCYRSGQLTARQLDGVLHVRGVRTVVNLRGDNSDYAWYRAEIATVRKSGARLVDAGLWTYSPPDTDVFHRLVQALDEAPEPVLIHCNTGNDRTGMASALYLLLRTDADFETTRDQLSLRFGHWPWGRARCQDRVLDRYAAWLAAHGLRHEPRHLRRWAFDVYQPE